MTDDDWQRAFDICAMWGPREESPRDLAARLLPVADALRSVVPRDLFRIRRGATVPIVPMGSDLETLTEQLASQILRNNTDRKPMPGGGYAAFWSDNTRRFARLEIQLHGGSDRGNSLVITFPVGALDAVDPAGVEQLVEVIATRFEPNWIEVASGAAPITQGSRGRRPKAGWGVWLNPAISPPASLAPRPMAGGTFVRVTAHLTWGDHVPADVQRDLEQLIERSVA